MKRSIRVVLLMLMLPTLSGSAQQPTTTAAQLNSMTDYQLYTWGSTVLIRWHLATDKFVDAYTENLHRDKVAKKNPELAALAGWKKSLNTALVGELNTDLPNLILYRTELLKRLALPDSDPHTAQEIVGLRKLIGSSGLSVEEDTMFVSQALNIYGDLARLSQQLPGVPGGTY